MSESEVDKLTALSESALAEYYDEPVVHVGYKTELSHEERQQWLKTRTYSAEKPNKEEIVEALPNWFKKKLAESIDELTDDIKKLIDKKIKIVRFTYKSYVSVKVESPALVVLKPVATQEELDDIFYEHYELGTRITKPLELKLLNALLRGSEWYASYSKETGWLISNGEVSAVNSDLDAVQSLFMGKEVEFISSSTPEDTQS